MFVGGKADVSFSDIEGGKKSIHVESFGQLVYGPGNIDADPLFVDAPNGDFHLCYTSPCCNMGTNTAPGLPTEDFEGDCRTNYGTADIGCDEHCTHLYCTGDEMPGGNVELKLVGLPQESPVGLCLSLGLIDPPLPSMWGDWYLDFDTLVGPNPLGQMPSNGVMIIEGTLPGTPAGPYSIYLQALIGPELTNLCTINVE